MQSNIGAACEEWQVVMPREIGNEMLVGIGFLTAQLMIEVCDEEDDPQLGLQFEENT